MIRDMSLKRDNWNFFVGADRFKTNFFLQFLDPSMKDLYERHNIESTAYSRRCIYLAMWVACLCCSGDTFIQHLVTTMVAVLSLFGTMGPNTMRKILPSLEEISTPLAKKVLMVGILTTLYRLDFITNELWSKALTRNSWIPRGLDVLQPSSLYR